MTTPIQEVRNKECPYCEGTGQAFGVIAGEGKLHKGMQECITCEGTGKLVESKYIEELKWCRDFTNDPEFAKSMAERIKREYGDTI